MCYFEASKIVSKQRVKKSEAITAYKVLIVRKGYQYAPYYKKYITYESPHRHTLWRNDCFKTFGNTVVIDSYHGPLSSTGIFAFKSKYAASKYKAKFFPYFENYKVVEIKLYGHVVEFKGPTGYLATRAEVVK